MSQTPAPSSETRPTITVSEGTHLVTVVERFDVSVDQQPKAVADATHHLRKAWKSEPGFVGAILLRSRNRGGVSCYSQWKPPADGTVPMAPPTAWSLAAALPDFERLDSRTFRVEFTAQAPSAGAPTRASLQGTQCAHFGIFTVTRENQDRLLDLARKFAPTSLDTPGIVAVNFHRSLDGREVINLGLWTSVEHFAFLKQKQGFRDGNPYWQGVADFQFDFFDVVAVESAS